MKLQNTSGQNVTLYDHYLRAEVEKAWRRGVVSDWIIKKIHETLDYFSEEDGEDNALMLLLRIRSIITTLPPVENTSTMRVLDLIFEEHQRQEKLYGDNNHSLERWLTVLNKTMGDLSNAILDDNEDEVRKQTIQVATIAMQIAQTFLKESSAE